MDSWTDKQLALMKNGGNDKCSAYLKKHGIDARTPIKQKYESDAAQLYKECLKARVEGRPEPTQLPKPVPKQASSFGSTGSAGAGGDPNGMERLAGESDQQYIARQTRLREEARARMANKFGGGGMGGVGSGGGGGGGGGRMQGIGSDPSYNPNAGYGGGDMGVDSLVSGFGSFASSMKNTVSSTISSTLTEDNLKAVKSTGASFWGSLTAGVSTVATTLTKPQEDDGLAQLQREVASHKPMESKYTGFGGGQTGFSNNPSSMPSAPAPASSPSGGMMQPPSSGGGGGTQQEAPGLPHEDRNGIERLTGESDEQYIVRQTRLRDEARARMAAKFGGGGMSSASSSSAPAVPRTAPSSGNSPFRSAPTAPAPGIQSAPSSGNRPTKLSTPAKPVNSDDFFSSFGT